MDLGTIRRRVRSGHYQSVVDFVADVKLVRDNCYAYNASWNPGILPVADYIFQSVSESLKEV
jgi:hypothetical protein